MGPRCSGNSFLMSGPLEEAWRSSTCSQNPIFHTPSFNLTFPIFDCLFPHPGMAPRGHAGPVA